MNRLSVVVARRGARLPSEVCAHCYNITIVNAHVGQQVSVHEPTEDSSRSHAGYGSIFWQLTMAAAPRTLYYYYKLLQFCGACRVAGP